MDLLLQELFSPGDSTFGSIGSEDATDMDTAPAIMAIAEPSLPPPPPQMMPGTQTTPHLTPIVSDFSNKNFNNYNNNARARLDSRVSVHEQLRQQGLCG